jgi:repressor LexA
MRVIINGTNCPEKEDEMKQEIYEDIKRAIEEYFYKYERCPSLRELEKKTKIPKSTVQRYILKMEKEGIIEKSNDGYATALTRKLDGSYVRVAKIGEIPCGPLQDEEELVEEYYKLPRGITGEGEFYLLTAQGDSMIEAGIDSGDLVLVKRQDYARQGDIVVALVDGKNTLKRYMLDENSKRIILHPENKRMKDIITKECKIQGVAVKVIKSL